MKQICFVFMLRSHSKIFNSLYANIFKKYLEIQNLNDQESLACLTSL